MWRNFRCIEILDVEKFQMWRNFGLNTLNLLFTADFVYVNLRLVAICAILSQNLFYSIYAILSKTCFVVIYALSMWRKIESQFLSVEKK